MSRSSLAYVFSRTDTARMNVNDPDRPAPAYEQSLNGLGARGRMLSQAERCRRGRELVSQGNVFARINRLLVDPFNPALPYAGHGVPFLCLRPVNMPDPLPSIICVYMLQM